MISADAAPPCDRPNLSKDYLAGNAPEEWIPLRGRRLVPRAAASTCGSARAWNASTSRASAVQLDGGDSLSYDALLLATGAEPVRTRAAGRRPADAC